MRRCREQTGGEMRAKLIQCLLVLICTVAASLSAAEEPAVPKQSAFSFRWENDTFGNTDATYTNGISFSLTRLGKGPLGGVWELGGVAGGQKSTVYELTQFQFTPSDLSSSSPAPNDRPYAGLTYLACMSHLQQEESLQSLKLLAGVIGPASGAGEVQNFTHRLLNQRISRGWSHQLKNEPIVNLLYEYRFRYRLTPEHAAFGVELIPMAGGFLGNYLIQAQSELLFRIGYHLPDDFGATSLRGIGYLPLPGLAATAPTWGVNVYARGGANLVARNMTLDGNTFAHSQSADKRQFVPMVEAGVALWNRRFMTTASFQIWGDEFNGQPVQEGYGSILISYLY